MAEEIDTTNYACVAGTSDGGIKLLNAPRYRMDKETALVMAAWIVVMADPAGERFPAILEAVKNT